MQSNPVCRNMGPVLILGRYHTYYPCQNMMLPRRSHLQLYHDLQDLLHKATDPVSGFRVPDQRVGLYITLEAVSARLGTFLLISIFPSLVSPRCFCWDSALCSTVSINH